MKYVKMWADTPFCGTDITDYQEVPNDITDEELNEQCDELSHSNAENFSYLATGWDEGFANEEEENDYFNDCLSYGGWKYISKEEYEENA